MGCTVFKISCTGQTASVSCKRTFSRKEASYITLSSFESHFAPAMVEAFKGVDEKFHQLRVALQDSRAKVVR